MHRVLGLVLMLLLSLQAPAAADLATAEAATQLQKFTGYTRARTVLILSAEESGRVQQLFADVGDAIPAGGRFACLDDSFLKLEQRANETEQARARVDIEYFRKQVRRYSSLVAGNSSAQIQLDEFERNLQSAIQQLEGLKIQSSVLAERGQRHCIPAPTGWLVMDRQVETGQWVTRGQQVARVGDFSRLLIPFALSSAEYQALQRVEALRVRLADSRIELPARIARVSPAFDEVSRKIPVELEIGDGLQAQRGGLRVQLSLRLPLASGAVVLPRAALSERYEQYWLKREDGSEVKVIYLGRDEAERVRVISPEVLPGQRFQLPEG
ncbi:MAG: efflux RND transporter periplasmic adaptor subunit [Gammaproteobacteria bacterium]|nr:efflux RND transporter periplasmic adaptor subunit [Gammaproteobacteria bacterium]